MSHLLHPHPEIQTQIKLSEPLSAAILISPWVKFATDYDSIKRCAGSDLVGAVPAIRWGSLFLGEAPPDKYNEATLADGDWFSGLDSQAKDILLWAGGAEVLIDSIASLAKTLKKAHPKMEYVVESGAAHSDFIMEKMIGYTRKAEGTRLVEAWLSERV